MNKKLISKSRVLRRQASCKHWSLLVALALPLPVLVHAQAQSDAKAAPAVQVRTTRVEAQTVQVSRTGVGNAQALATVTIRSRVDGQLDSVAFEEGQEIKAGQVLARIDPRLFQAQLSQASAQKAKDQVLLDNARADLLRYQQLISDDAVSQQALDTQRALVAQLQASIQSDEALIQLAKLQLSYTEISSPISGRAGARLVDPGNVVHASDPGGLVVINQIDPIAVQFTLPESEFPAVSQAMHPGAKPLHVQAIDRLTNQVLADGQLVLLNNQIDSSTGTFVMKARFANPARKLWPGQSVSVRLTLGERGNALTVPTAAIQRNQAGFFVYVVDSGADKVHVQPVNILQQMDSRSVVDGGLKAGDRIVVDGLYRLTPGASIVEAKANAASAPAAQGAKP